MHPRSRKTETSVRSIGLGGLLLRKKDKGGDQGETAKDLGAHQDLTIGPYPPAERSSAPENNRVYAKRGSWLESSFTGSVQKKK